VAKFSVTVDCILPGSGLGAVALGLRRPEPTVNCGNMSHSESTQNVRSDGIVIICHGTQGASRKKRSYEMKVSGLNKKLSYRRGTARCVVSVEILPTATQVDRRRHSLSGSELPPFSSYVDKTRFDDQYAVAKFSKS